jgi:hypothetical protein
VAFVAASPLLGQGSRKVMIDFLRLWQASPFVGSAGRLRRCVLTFPSGSPYTPAGNSGHGALVVRGERRWFVRGLQGYYGNARDHHVLELAAGGSFDVPPGASLESEQAVDDRPWSADHVARFLDALERQGPAAISEDAIQALARRTGLSRPEAALLWSGLPGLDGWEHDFLGKEGREALGLKAAEAKVARDALQKVPREVRREVLAAAMAGDPGAPWCPLGSGPDDDQSPVARAAKAWNHRMGQRLSVAPELLVRCARELPRGVDPSAFIAALADCTRVGAWTRDGDWQLGEGGPARVPAAKDEVFSGAILLATARYVSFLFEALPVGDPLRAMLPEAVRLSRKRLAHTGLIVAAYSRYFAEKIAERDAFLDAIGAEPYPRGCDRAGGRDGGLLLARASRWALQVAFRPSRIPQRPDAAVGLVAGHPAFEAARYLLSEETDRLAQRVVTTPVAAAGYEANPLLSVADLVDEVRQAKGLSEEAGALYLQLLALRAPTAKAVQDWNGWTTARYKKAAAELAAVKLVLVAKRARAGREHFLPGAWEDLKAPDLPIESWKLPLYGAGRSEVGLHTPLGVLLPLRPTHELFQAAWVRVKAGDEPRYEEVK